MGIRPFHQAVKFINFITFRFLGR